MHQLVVAEARQSASDPNEDEDQESDFRYEPESGHQDELRHRDSPNARERDEDNAEDGEGEGVAFSSGLYASQEAGGRHHQEEERWNPVRNGRRQQGMPSAEEQQCRNAADID